MILDTLHQQMRDLFVEELKVALATGSIPEKIERQVDELFDSCPGGECCDQCAQIFCPYGEGLHFHHDGCPCCSSDPAPTDRGARHIARTKRWQKLLTRNTRP